MWDQNVLVRALDFATRAHGDQRVPGSGFPYVVHLTKVTTEAMRACAEDPSLDATTTLTAALLHDCVEDAGISVERVASEFGEVVAQCVSALTKDASLPKSHQMGDSLARLVQAPREARVVKLADRVSNLEPPPPHWSIDKRRAYREEAIVIRDALRGSSAWLEARIEARIASYASYCVDA